MTLTSTQVVNTLAVLALATSACAGYQDDADSSEPFAEHSAALEGAETSCVIRTSDGHYVTAVDGGGHGGDSIYTDATNIGDYERFTFVETTSPDSTHVSYGIRTFDGHYLTAVDGGGRTSDVIHSDAVSLSTWESFTVSSRALGVYAIRTSNGHYLEAVGGGGKVDDTIRSESARIGDWERFGLVCEL